MATFADHRQVLKVQNGGRRRPGHFPFIRRAGGRPEYYVADPSVDLTPYSEKYGWKDKFFSWALNAGPLTTSCTPSRVLRRNRLVVQRNPAEEKGWQMPTNRADFEKFRQTVQDDGMIPLAHGASIIKIANDWIMTQYIGAVCGKRRNQKVLTGGEKVDRRTHALRFEMIVKDWQAGWIGNKQSQSISQDDATALLYQKAGGYQAGGLLAVCQYSNRHGQRHHRRYHRHDAVSVLYRGGRPCFPLGNRRGILRKRQHKIP